MCSSNFSTEESFWRFCSIKISIAPFRSLLKTDEIKHIDNYLQTFNVCQNMVRNIEIVAMNAFKNGRNCFNNGIAFEPSVFGCGDFLVITGPPQVATIRVTG